jgi:hypothetical protein
MTVTLTRLAALATLSRGAGEGLVEAFFFRFSIHRQRPRMPAGRTARVSSRNPNATAGAQDGP